MKYKRLFLVTIFLLIISSYIIASPYFTGFTGGGIKTNIKKTTANAFLAGQIDFSNNFFTRLDLSLQTENIFGSNFLASTPSIFNLDEFSLTFKGNMGALAHYLSGFIGNPEPIGSSVFLERHFGVPNFNSMFLTPQGSENANKIFPISGIGLNYLFKTKKTVTGLYVYYNKLIEKDNTSLTLLPVPNFGAPLTNDIESTDKQQIVQQQIEENKSINIDFRFALSSNFVYLDMGGGCSFPFGNKDDSGNDVILIVREANFHCGLNLFLGSTYMSNLLFQLGFTHLDINPNELKEEKVIALEDIYVFIEPRFVTKKISFAFAIFNIPPVVSEKLFYVTNPFGVNVSIYSNNFSIKNKTSQLGCHFTVSLPELTFNIDKSQLQVQVSPFFNIELGSGQFYTNLIFDFSDFENFTSNMCLDLRYKIGI